MKNTQPRFALSVNPANSRDRWLGTLELLAFSFDSVLVSALQVGPVMDFRTLYKCGLSRDELVPDS